MTTHPQPKCGLNCRLYEQCTEVYDDDERPPCCASHSSAQSEQEIRKDERETVLDTLTTQLTKLWEEAKERSGEEDWDDTHSFSLPYLKQIIAELRSKQASSWNAIIEYRLPS